MAGRHGKGAAKYAREHMGAIYGVGTGLQGSSYAIPTKDAQLRSMTLSEIEPYVKEFLDFAKDNQQFLFLLTPVGTGLAGNSKFEMLKMLTKYKIHDNVVFVRQWFQE